MHVAHSTSSLVKRRSPFLRKATPGSLFSFANDGTGSVMNKIEMKSRNSEVRTDPYLRSNSEPNRIQNLFHDLFSQIAVFDGKAQAFFGDVAHLK